MRDHGLDAGAMMPGQRTGFARWLARILLWIVLGAAAFRLYRSPWAASNLGIVPDSVEYAVGAQRFATLGRYDIEIDHVAYPPQSSPWFPVCCLSPAYLVAPGEIGAGIVVVLFFSLVGVLAAFALGRRLAGDWGGAAAATVLGCNGVYRSYSREIMTDVPAVALGLCACWLFLRLRERDRPLREWALAGALCAGSLAIRSNSLTLLLPFAWLAIRARRALTMRFFALLAPSAAEVLATSIYNHAIFGDWRRSGYQFWTPIPWDYPELLFSTSYLQGNFAELLLPSVLPWVLAGAFGAVVLLLLRNREIQPVLLFLALAAVPPSIAHLFFFFPQERFHLLPIAVLCVLGGAGLCSLVPEAARRRSWIVSATIPLLLVVIPRKPDAEPFRRIIAEVLARETPPDAVIVTSIDPVYLEPIVVRGTSRRIVPLSREVEYASKAVAWKRIQRVDPAPSGPTDHRAPGLLAAGAVDVCAFTADEDPKRLIEMAREGIPVFIELRSATNKQPVPSFLHRILGEAPEIVPHPQYPWLARIKP